MKDGGCSGPWRRVFFSTHDFEFVSSLARTANDDLGVLGFYDLGWGVGYWGLFGLISTQGWSVIIFVHYKSLIFTSYARPGSKTLT